MNVHWCAIIGSHECMTGKKRKEKCNFEQLQPRHNNSLLRFVLCGNVDETRNFLANNEIALDEINKALIISSGATGPVSMMELLVDHGVDVNYADRNGEWTSLMEAADKSKLDK